MTSFPRLFPSGMYDDEPIAFGAVAQDPGSWSERSRAQALAYYESTNDPRYADRVAALKATDPSGFF